MSRTIIAGALFYTAMLIGCAADTTALVAIEHGPVEVEQSDATGVATMETTASMDSGEEPVGETQQDLTQWQKLCALGCSAFAGAGCASVGASCVAGALWSFGGILIPCSYAVVAACTGSTTVITVCGIKCLGG